MQGIKAVLRDMLGPAVGVGVTDPRYPPTGLFPEEAAAMTRAVPKRRAEFAAGRRAARNAMAEIGLRPCAIPQGNHGAPQWSAGLSGSIAHCDSCCISVVAHAEDYATVGVDIEPATALDADLIPVICNSSERDWVKKQSDAGLAAKLIFSAKEAVYKAQYPLTGKVIGFDEVTLVITGDRFAVMSDLMLPDLRGSILIQHGLIISTCYV